MAEDVARQSACLNRKQFQTALNTTRTALASFLERGQNGNRVSYESLCHDYALTKEALQWMKAVDKDIRCSGALNNEDFSSDTVTYVVFYWTCVKLKVCIVCYHFYIFSDFIQVRSVKSTKLVSEYGVSFANFQELHSILEENCRDIRDRIDLFISKARLERPANTSPSVFRADSSPIKGPVGIGLNVSPLKRKNITPGGPGLSPDKRPRTSSPLKLNRLPVATNLSTPKRINVVKDVGTTVSTPQNSLKERTNRLAIANVKTPSQKRQHEGKAIHIASPSTPTPALRKRLEHFPPQTLDEDVEMKDAQVDESSVASDEDDTLQCHHLQPFKDREFYLHRDPRAEREWNRCFKTMDLIIERLGRTARAT